MTKELSLDKSPKININVQVPRNLRVYNDQGSPQLPQRKKAFELQSPIIDFFAQKRNQSKTTLESRPNPAQIAEEARKNNYLNYAAYKPSNN